MFVDNDDRNTPLLSSVGAASPPRNMPSLRDSRDQNETVFCYKHTAPTELKAQACATFQKVFDLLIVVKIIRPSLMRAPEPGHDHINFDKWTPGVQTSVCCKDYFALL